MNYRIDHFNIIQKMLFKMSRKYLSDERLIYFTMKRWFKTCDLKNPSTFNEKLQWLKLNDRKEHYTLLADKVLVKEFVSKTIGKQYISKTLSTWENSNEISFSSLPLSFVIKTNHGSGGNIIVKDKNDIDIEHVKAIVGKWMNECYYEKGREWVYKDIKRKILCEELLLDENGNIPSDYKLFCFNGKPKFIQVDINRFENHERVFYDINWTKQDFNLLYPMSEKTISKPERLQEMINLAEKISKNIPFCRVDFYSLPEIKFGEITFYPEGATGIFHPPIWDKKLGDMISLKDIN